MVFQQNLFCGLTLQMFMDQTGFERHDPKTFAMRGFLNLFRLRQNGLKILQRLTGACKQREQLGKKSAWAKGFCQEFFEVTMRRFFSLPNKGLILNDQKIAKFD